MLLHIHPIIQSDASTIQGLLQVHAAAVRSKTQGIAEEQKNAWLACLDEERLKEAVDSLESLVFGGYVEGSLVGFVVLKGDVVDMLFTSPDAPKGTGRALLIHVEEEARRRGVTALKVQASINAVGFYEHMEFAAAGEAGPCSSCSTVPAVWMEKGLSQKS